MLYVHFEVFKSTYINIPWREVCARAFLVSMSDLLASRREAQ